MNKQGASALEGNEVNQELGEHDSLDWSVSGISVASAMDPDRFRTEYLTQSSAGESLQSSPIREPSLELRQLEGQFKSLETNLRHISEKATTPTSSPRRSRHVQQRPLDITPPVRDPGPDKSTDEIEVTKKLDFTAPPPPQITRFDQMRCALKDLDFARQKLSNSKIPVLTKAADASQGSAVETSRHRTSLDDEFNSINDFLEKVKNSAVGQNQSATENNSTVVENYTLRSDANETAKRSSNFEAESWKTKVAELEEKLNLQNEAIISLKQRNEKKDSQMIELKSRWSRAMTDLSKDQEELAEKLKESRNQCDQLKVEYAAAKEQFMVCEEELAKALEIASDFRKKLDDEEHIKQDMLNQLLSERSAKSKQLLAEQARVLELSNRLEELSTKVATLEKENAGLSFELKTHENHQLATEKADEYYKQVAAEAEKLKKKLVEAQEERKTTESSLHTFYSSQMEEILAEKIDHLQANVHKWEENLLRDKQESLTIMKNEYETQIETLKQRLFDEVSNQYEAQIKVLNAALDASRAEAEALRRQLLVGGDRERPSIPENHVKIFQNNISQEQEVVERRERIWREILLRSMSDKRAQDDTQAEPTTFRHHSQGRRQNEPSGDLTETDDSYHQNTKSLNNFGPRGRRLTFRRNEGHVSLNSMTLSSIGDRFMSTNEVMTEDEKKIVIENFVKEYLQQNPEAAADPQLVASLQCMATRLVDSDKKDSLLKK